MLISNCSFFLVRQDLFQLATMAAAHHLIREIPPLKCFELPVGRTNAVMQNHEETSALPIYDAYDSFGSHFGFAIPRSLAVIFSMA